MMPVSEPAVLVIPNAAMNEAKKLFLRILMVADSIVTNQFPHFTNKENHIQRH